MNIYESAAASLDAATNKLTAEESALLGKHERTIRQTERAFLACGKALAEIRDQKLYRAAFSTFEDYCQIVWGWGRERTRLMIEGASITAELPPEVQPLIRSDGQARALAGVPKEARETVVLAADATGKVTRGSILKAAARVKKQNANLFCQKSVDPEGLATDSAPVVKDATGFAIPAALLPMWNRRGEVTEVLKALSEARSAVRQAMKTEDPLFAAANMSGACHDLSHSYSMMQLAMPYAVCFTCLGVSSEECPACKGRGFISKHHYDVSVPPEVKAARARSCASRG